MDFTEKLKTGCTVTGCIFPKSRPRKGTTMVSEPSEKITDSILKRIFSEAYPQ